MVNQDLTALTAITTPLSTDILYVVNDPAVSKNPRKATIADVLKDYDDQTSTFTNKTFDLGGTGNSFTGTKAQFNTALSDFDEFVTTTTINGATVEKDFSSTGIGISIKDTHQTSGANGLYGFEALNFYADTSNGTYNPSSNRRVGSLGFYGSNNIGDSVNASGFSLSLHRGTSEFQTILNGDANTQEFYFSRNNWSNYYQGALQYFFGRMRIGAGNVTASTTQTQGQQVLTNSINNVNVANTNDVVTLPFALLGNYVTVMNSTNNVIQIYPNTNDYIGEGSTVNAPITLEPHRQITLIGRDSAYWRIISEDPWTIKTSTRLIQNDSVALTDESDTSLILQAFSGTADDLLTLTSGSNNQYKFLYADAGDTITLKHQASPTTDQFVTLAGADKVLSETVPTLVVRRNGVWYEYGGGGGGGGSDTPWTENHDFDTYYYDMENQSKPADPATNNGRYYQKAVDGNNDALFVIQKKGGAFVEVQVS